MRLPALALALTLPLSAYAEEAANRAESGAEGGRERVDRREQVERIAERAAALADEEARKRSLDIGPPEFELEDLEAIGALLGLPPSREAMDDRALGVQRALELMRREIARRSSRLSEAELSSLLALFEGAIVRNEGALIRIRRPRFSAAELEALARHLEKDETLRVDLRLCCGRRADEKRAHEALSSLDEERRSIRSLRRGMRGAQLLIIREGAPQG